MTTMDTLMVKVYADLIRRGRKTLDEVPETIKEAVAQEPGISENA